MGSFRGSSWVIAHGAILGRSGVMGMSEESLEVWG